MSLHLKGIIDIPETASDEYNLWLQALNDAQNDWAGVDYDWEGLYKVQNTTLSQSGTTLSLPYDFVKLAGFPMFNTTEYPEQRKQETGTFDTTASYVTIDYANKVLAVNPPQASTVTARIPYYHQPTGLTSLSSVSLCPNDNYLLYNAVGKVLLTRENPKYSEYMQQAEVLLQQMIGKEVVRSDQYDNTSKNDLHTKHAFTLGID